MVAIRLGLSRWLQKRSSQILWSSHMDKVMLLYLRFPLYFGLSCGCMYQPQFEGLSYGCMYQPQSERRQWIIFACRWISMSRDRVSCYRRCIYKLGYVYFFNEKFGLQQKLWPTWWNLSFVDHFCLKYSACPDIPMNSGCTVHIQALRWVADVQCIPRYSDE